MNHASATAAIAHTARLDSDKAMSERKRDDCPKDETPLQSDGDLEEQESSFFLNALDLDETTAAVAVSDNSNESAQDERTYECKKPRWWTKLCHKPTPAQQRAIANTVAHQLERIPYGQTMDWKAVFSSTLTGSNVNDAHDNVWLELGFGSGDNLLCLAQQFRTTRCFVGAEIHAGGVGRVLQHVQQGIERQQYWTDYTKYDESLDPSIASTKSNVEQSVAVDDEELDATTMEDPYANLRVYRGDGIKLLPYIASDSLQAVLVTFPDPFEKKHHEKWRVIQTGTLREIRRVLRPGGQFFLATDHEGYHHYSHQTMQEVNETSPSFELVEPCPPRTEWLPVISRYEQKGWDEGRRTWLSCWKAL